MERSPTYPYQKNLEQIDEEIQAGVWRIAAFVDLVGEKKYLRFQTHLISQSVADPILLEFRGKSASAISPRCCPRILYSTSTDKGTELLTPYSRLLVKIPQDGLPLNRLLKEIIEILGRFEKFNFIAPNLSPASIGIGDGEEILLLPNAYILPFFSNEGLDSANHQPDAYSPISVNDSPYPCNDPTIHLHALARLMQHLVIPLNKTSRPSPADDDAFKHLIQESVSGIQSGEIASLSDLNKKLFGEPLPASLQPFHARFPGMPLNPQAEAIVKKILNIANEGCSSIVLKGEAFSGKSTILDEVSEKLIKTDGGAWKIIRPDDWSLFPKSRKKALPKGTSVQKCLWIVDDVSDRAFIYSQFSRKFLEDPSCAGGLLLLAFDSDHVSKEAVGFLDDLKTKFGERYCEIALPIALYEWNLNEEIETASRAERSPRGKDFRVTERNSSDRLKHYFHKIMRYLAPESAPSGQTSLKQLAREILDRLLEEERQLLEFVSVARFAVPLDIALSIFPGSDGQIHQCIHRLSALGLLKIAYRPNEAINGESISLSSRSASIRRLVYQSIPDERRKNLHRTVALHAEERSAFPAFFLIHHLLEGGENHLAVKHCVRHLKDTSSEDRDPLILEHCRKLIHQNLHESIPLPNRLLVLREVGVELLKKGQPVEAETQFLHAWEILKNAEPDERRKNAELASSICRLLADAWESRGEYKKALDLLNAVREELQTALSLPDQARLLNDIGWLQYRLGNYENSMESCKLSLATLNPNQYPLVVAQALNIMGVAHFNTSRYDEAIRYYERSAFLRERAKDVSALSASYNNLALAYQTKGEYDKALDYYKKSLEIKKNEKNRIGIAAGYLNLALLHLDMHDFDEAEKRCKESLEISTEHGFAMLTAEIFSTLGDIDRLRGHYDEGEKFYLDSLRISRDLESINVELGAHRRLATLYLTQEIYNKSREHVEKASELARLIGSKYESAQIDMILGDLETAQNKQMEALTHYEKAASTFTTLSKNRSAASALAKIGLLHARSMNTIEAMQYLDRAESQVRYDFGHILPEEIITLRRELENQPSPTYVPGTQSQNLLTSFYELSLLFDSTSDRHKCIKRILDLTRSIIGPDECRLILKVDGRQFLVIDGTGREKPLQDTGLTVLLNRTLLLGCVLDSTSPDVSDIASQIDVGEGGFVCIPLKAMGADLGCLLFYMPSESLPVSKDRVNFFTALGRHIAGILMLMFHQEEHIHKEERLEKEVEALKAQVEDQYHFKNLIGKSESMKKIFRTVQKVMNVDTGILFVGESGTGKTELARATHYSSSRSNKTFQDIHCAQIPVSLLESELFGHERGAFTSAVGRKLGLCEIADGGTIFLDDINTLSSEMQKKLLKFLESKSFTRIGGTKPIHSDVRIISASNEDLEELCRQGKFREDLYFRLKVIQIRIPPLRERKEDIPAIAMEFLKKRCNEAGKPLKTLAPDTIRLLQKFSWPGNVRELHNILEQVVLLSDEDVIHPHSLPEEFLGQVSGVSVAPRKDLEALIQRIIELGNYSKENPLIPQVDALLAKKMVDFVEGKGKAASLLGITKPTLYARLKDYDKMR